MKTFFLVYLPLSILLSLSGVCHAQTVEATVAFDKVAQPMQMERMGLGQGGLTQEVVFAGRLPEIKALKPALIRLFVQEYYRLLPEPGTYYFDSLDSTLHAILQTGAKPLMSLCFKPASLFPVVDEDIVEPNDYGKWEDLVYNLVKHCKEKGMGIRYWEVGNEVDIGESGGTPYRFKPESYVRYYRRTVAAILRADPTAKVGGPALAHVRSPILPALLDACDAQKIRLDFVSWHIYHSSPLAVRETIDYVHGLLKKHPSLKPETILDEWNMDLFNPPLNPRFQPCYIAETVWQMKDAGLDWSCYYHIRDWYVSFETFSRFFSPKGTAFMTRWWNRQPQFSGLIDYQNQIRPSYFAFKLLSRMAGNRMQLQTNSDKVHGFATHDPQLQMYNAMLWNFSENPVTVNLTLESLPKQMNVRHIVIDATPAAVDENQRLKPEPYKQLKAGRNQLTVQLEPWAVHYWSFE